MLVSDLRAEAIDLVIAAGDAYEFCAIDLRADDLCRLQVSGDKDPCFEAFTGCLSRDGVCQIAGRGTRNCVEPKRARIRQCYCNDAVLKAQSGQAHRVVLDAEPLHAK